MYHKKEGGILGCNKFLHAVENKQYCSGVTGAVCLTLLYHCLSAALPPP